MKARVNTSKYMYIERYYDLQNICISMYANGSSHYSLSIIRKLVLELLQAFEHTTECSI